MAAGGAGGGKGLCPRRRHRRPPLFYKRDSEHQVWSTDAAAKEDSGLVRLSPEQCPPYGVITTQTCDLDEQAENPVQPFFQVCPAYRIDEKDKAAVLSRQHIHELTGEDLGEGIWVADLRIEVPLEKSVLVGRTPKRGFASEADQVAFAERLGRRRDRAALGNAISEILDRELSRKFRNNKTKAKRVFESVHRLGLAIVEGPRTEPIAVQLHVITKDGVVIDESADEQSERATELKDWFEAWWDKVREVGAAATPALRVLANEYHDGTAMDISVYEDLIPFERRP